MKKKNSSSVTMSDEQIINNNLMVVRGMAFEIAHICQMNPPTVVLGGTFKGTPGNFEEVFDFLNFSCVQKMSTDEFTQFYNECAIRGKLFYKRGEATGQGIADKVDLRKWNLLLEEVINLLSKSEFERLKALDKLKVYDEIECKVVELNLAPNKASLLKYVRARVAE